MKKKRKKQERKEKGCPVCAEPAVVMKVGKDAEKGWDELMHRMKTGQSVVFFLED